MEDSVKFEVAKLAKEKGYSFGGHNNYVQYHKKYIYDGDPNHPESYKKGDIKGFNMYHKNNEKIIDFSCKIYTIYEAPSQSFLNKWLREKHNLYLNVYLYCSLEPPKQRQFILEAIKENKDKTLTLAYSEYMVCELYEEAMEALLKKCIKDLI